MGAQPSAHNAHNLPPRKDVPKSGAVLGAHSHSPKSSRGFCCQVPPNPARPLLRRPGLHSVPDLGSRPHLESIIVVCSYVSTRLRRYHTGHNFDLQQTVYPTLPPSETHAGRINSLLFELVANTPAQPRVCLWWRRRVLPPGPASLQSKVQHH